MQSRLTRTESHPIGLIKYKFGKKLSCNKNNYIDSITSFNLVSSSISNPDLVVTCESNVSTVARIIEISQLVPVEHYVDQVFLP